MNEVRDVRDSLVELGDDLSEIELMQIHRTIIKRMKRKPIAMLLHVLGGFWAPFFYLRRPVPGVVFLIGYLILAARGWNVHGCILGIIAIAWVLGFFYFSFKVDTHNEETPRAVVDEYLELRRTIEEEL